MCCMASLSEVVQDNPLVSLIKDLLETELNKLACSTVVESFTNAVDSHSLTCMAWTDTILADS